MQILASEFRIVYTPFGPEAAARPPARRLRPPRRRLGPGLRLDRPHAQAEHRLGPARSARGAASPTTARCGSPPPRSAPKPAPLTGYVQYGRSLEHVDSTIDRVWFLIVAGILGGTLLASLAGVAIAGAGDAADRLADRDRARDRHHPRPLAADAETGDRRRGRRTGPDPGGDAALARRRPGRARGGDAEAARVRRRRLARAAHAADQRARQPRTAAGLARRRRARPKTARSSTRPCAPRGG